MMSPDRIDDTPATDANETERLLAEAAEWPREMGVYSANGIIARLCAKVRELQGERDAARHASEDGMSEAAIAALNLCAEWFDDSQPAHHMPPRKLAAVNAVRAALAAANASGTGGGAVIVCPYCHRLSVYRNMCLPCNRWVFWSIT